MQCRQKPKEPFWKYFKRFKDLLVQYPHHGVEKWRLCQILYDGLDYQNKTLLETMSQGRFLKVDEHEGYELYEDLAEKFIQCEPISEESRTVNLIPSKMGLHSIEMFTTYEVKFDGITRRLEDLETTDLSP